MIIVVILVVVLVFVPLLLFGISRARRGRAPAEPKVAGRGVDLASYAAFFAVMVVFGVGIPLFFLADNHSDASAKAGSIKLTRNQEQGREMFGEHCALCHTLAAANAIGKVGPNLDLLKPSESLTLNTISNGCLPNPPAGSDEACLGQGVMPAQEVTGQDATDVASFVARVAGNVN